MVGGATRRRTPSYFLLAKENIPVGKSKLYSRGTSQGARHSPTKEMARGCFAALLALLGVLQSSSAAFSWKACPDVSSKGSISSVSLSPDPPYPGSTASFVVEAVAGEHSEDMLSLLRCRAPPAY